MALAAFNALMEKLVYKGFQLKESTIIECNPAFLIKQPKKKWNYIYPKHLSPLANQGKV